MGSQGLVRSLLFGFFAGPVIAWCLATVVYYYPVQEAALRRGEVEEFAVWPLLVFGGLGAVLGILAAVSIGRRPLSPVVKHGALGALVGVAVVVLSTLVVADVMAGGWDKAGAAYLHAGLRYGVPSGLVVGVLAGLLVGARQRAYPGAAADRSPHAGFSES